MLETKRLIIRKHITSDGKDLYEYLALKQTYLFEPGEPIAEEDSREIITQRSAGNDFFAVVLKNENKMIGHLYFHQTDPKKFLTWELGYIFNPNYHNMGFCSEAAKEMIMYGFNKLDAHKIVSFCNPDNIASWRVLEKIGMEKEGFFKQKAFFRKDQNGVPLWHDCLAYGILSGNAR